MTFNTNVKYQDSHEWARTEGDLVVIVDSAAWSARVRYAGRALKQQLAEAGVDPVAKLRVRVRAPR